MIEEYVRLIKKYKKIENIPKEYMNKDMYEYGLIKNMDFFENIPYFIKTKEFCLEMLEKHIIDINLVPEEYLSSEICLNLMIKDIISYQQIPKKFLTREICLENYKSWCDFNEIPKEFLDEDFYLQIVIKYGDMHDVPKEKQTEEMLKNFFLLHDPSIQYLEYINTNKITKSLSYLIVDLLGYNIQFIPDKYKTLNMHLLAIKNMLYSKYYLIPKKLLKNKFLYKTIKNTNIYSKMNISYYYF
jgi:hypothetical protein